MNSGTCRCSGDLADHELEQVAGWFTVERFDAGKHLAREGAADYRCFILQDETARVERDDRRIATPGPGEVYGELAILGDGRRVAEVIAETDVRVFSIFGTDFVEMRKRLTAVAEQLDALSRRRLEELDS